MVLSNVEIIKALQQGHIKISDLTDKLDPEASPFNATSIDLRLAPQISVPQGGPMAYDLREGDLKRFLKTNARKLTLSEEQPFLLKPYTLILGQTLETVDFTIQEGTTSFSARIEGRSSFARCGVLMHITAPTIHAGYRGTITLEIVNLGPTNFLLFPRMYVCQLLIETVQGIPKTGKSSQFHGQNTPEGTLEHSEDPHPSAGR